MAHVKAAGSGQDWVCDQRRTWDAAAAPLPAPMWFKKETRWCFTSGLSSAARPKSSKT